MKNKTFPVYLVFLCMGFGDVVGPLVGLAKESFTLSYTMAQLIPFTGFIMFGLLSIPTGIFQERFGKKIILNTGLFIALLGLTLGILNGLYGSPHSLIKSNYNFFILLITILSLCAGATILQVVGNPLVYDISSSSQYSRNLILAQFYKSIGSSLGFILPPLAMTFLKLEWSVLFPIFSAVVLITIFSSQQLKIVNKKNNSDSTIKFCLALLKDKYVLMMVLSIFLYVGAEVSMSSNIPIFLREYIGISDYSLWVSWGLFFLPLVIGRFSGSLILHRISARMFLIYTSILSIGGIVLLFTTKDFLVFLGIALAGFGFANIFPLIFSITIEKIPDRANELSGLMISAISGGAIIPLIMGSISDALSLLVGFSIPFFCLLYILFVAIMNNYSFKIQEI